jgi:hypothetical protein
MDHVLPLQLRKTFLSVLSSNFRLVSHNNFSRGSNLRSTVIMRSSSCYGLMGLKFLSLKFRSKCPYLSYTQHSVYFAPPYIIDQLLPSPPYRLFIFRTVELTINRDIYKYVPCYHATFWSWSIQQSMNQFSNIHWSVTTFAHDELWWSSVSIKLPPFLTLFFVEVKCGLSAAAAVYVHSVECA